MLQTSVEVQSSLALFERIFQYLDLAHEIVDAPGAKALPPDRLRGEVALRDVWFRYEDVSGNGDGDSPWTLEDVALEVAAGPARCARRPERRRQDDDLAT